MASNETGSQLDLNVGEDEVHATYSNLKYSTGALRKDNQDDVEISP